MEPTQLGVEHRAVQPFNIQFPNEIWSLVISEACDPLSEKEMLEAVEHYLRSISSSSTRFYDLIQHNSFNDTDTGTPKFQSEIVNPSSPLHSRVEHLHHWLSRSSFVSPIY